VIRTAENRNPHTFTEGEQRFLDDGFKDAADRMTAIATAVGTAGSFVLVLVALLVGFATSTSDQSNKLVTASNKEAQLLRGCSEKAQKAPCNATKLEQAHAEVEMARQRLSDLGRLNQAQAITGGLVVVAFLLGLAALLTNPVPGPDGSGKGHASVLAWRRALERLKTKRRWIQASLLFQIGAIVSIAYLGWNVFGG
jgi:hypothetical protein